MTQPHQLLPFGDWEKASGTGGYSRSSLADRTRFYGYALGSTREAIHWYNSLHIELGSVAEDRQAVLIQIRRLLLTTLRNSRSQDPTTMLSDFKPKK